MKAIKENWKLVLIVAAGIVAVIFMCIFGIQGHGSWWRCNPDSL